MKKILLFSLPFFMYAANMPPMPPALPGLSSPNAIHKSSTKNAKLPKSCEMIPPMIYKLPPPLEKLLNKCKNDMYKPEISKIQTIFGKEIKQIHVKPLEDFSKIYKISFALKGKKIIKYCNETLTYCFESAPQKNIP